MIRVKMIDHLVLRDDWAELRTLSGHLPSQTRTPSRNARCG